MTQFKNYTDFIIIAMRAISALFTRFGTCRFCRNIPIAETVTCCCHCSCFKIIANLASTTLYAIFSFSRCLRCMPSPHNVSNLVYASVFIIIAKFAITTNFSPSETGRSFCLRPFAHAMATVWNESFSANVTICRGICADRTLVPMCTVRCGLIAILARTFDPMPHFIVFVFIIPDMTKPFSHKITANGTGRICTERNIRHCVCFRRGFICTAISLTSKVVSVLGCHPVQIMSQRTQRFLRSNKSAILTYNLNISTDCTCGCVELHFKIMRMQNTFITFAILNMKTHGTNSNRVFASCTCIGEHYMPFTICMIAHRKNGLFFKYFIADQTMFSLCQSCGSTSRRNSRIHDFNMCMP